MRLRQRAPWLALALTMSMLLGGCGMTGTSGVGSSQGASFGVLGQLPFQRLDPVPVHAQRFPARIIAHRGFSGRFPENTIASIRGAVQAGADLVEIDVQLTKDGELVVLHDDTVDRTTNGKGEVKALTLQEIRALDAGVKFDATFTGERVPTLEEALDAVRGGAILNIEVKGIEQAGMRPVVAKKIKDLVELKNYGPHVHLMSFDEAFMQEMRQQAPTWSMGLLGVADPFNLKLKQAQKLKMDGLHLLHKAVSADEVLDIHRAGLSTHVYTVNRPGSMLKVLRRGVDGVITNHPDLAGTVMETHFSGKPLPTLPEPLDEDID